MSAALQLQLQQPNSIWAAADAMAGARKPVAAQSVASRACTVAQIDQAGARLVRASSKALKAEPCSDPVVSFAFYRQHTEKLLRRYHYASMQVGRSPSLLSESVGRGWASSRRVRTFEDAVIFCLDIERCLGKLTPIERQLITRIAVQEYTRAEAASLSGICTRTISSKYPQALDHLTELLVESDLLVLPD